MGPGLRNAIPGLLAIAAASARAGVASNPPSTPISAAASTTALAIEEIRNTVTFASPCTTPFDAMPPKSENTGQTPTATLLDPVPSKKVNVKEVLTLPRPISTITSGPQTVSLMSCTTSHYTVRLPHDCRDSGISKSCLEDIRLTSSCIDYSNSPPDCLWNSTQIWSASKTTIGFFPFLQTVTQWVTDVNCVSASPRAAGDRSCVSWGQWATPIIDYAMGNCPRDSLSVSCSTTAWQTKSECIESLPPCAWRESIETVYSTVYDGDHANYLYEAADVCRPFTGTARTLCTTHTIYSPHFLDSGTTVYKQSPTCLYNTTGCIAYNTLGGDSICLSLNEATRNPYASISAIDTSQTSSSLEFLSSTFTCQYGTRTIPFTWTTCASAGACATSSSTVTECREWLRTSTQSWEEISSSSSSSTFSAKPTLSYSQYTRTASMTASATVKSGSQKLEIDFLDQSGKMGLQHILQDNCIIGDCDNAAIVQELWDCGFGADLVIGDLEGLDNANSCVGKTLNTTRVWVIEAGAEAMIELYQNGDAIENPLSIDEKWQALAKEKMPECEDDTPTTTTSMAEEAPTLTPVCMLKEQPTMDPRDFAAIQQHLEDVFNQAPFLPPPPSCQMQSVWGQPACNCSIYATNDIFSTKAGPVRTVVQEKTTVTTADLCSYTEWPPSNASQCADASCWMTLPPTASLPTGSMTMVPTSTASCLSEQVGWKANMIEAAVNGFCRDRSKEQGQASTGWSKSSDFAHETYPGDYDNSFPPGSPLVLYTHFVQEACPKDVANASFMDVSACMGHFTFVAQQCPAFALGSQLAYKGGFYFADCVAWYLGDEETFTNATGTADSPVEPEPMPSSSDPWMDQTVKCNGCEDGTFLTADVAVQAANFWSTLSRSSVAAKPTTGAVNFSNWEQKVDGKTEQGIKSLVTSVGTREDSHKVLALYVQYWPWACANGDPAEVDFSKVDRTQFIQKFMATSEEGKACQSSCAKSGAMTGGTSYNNCVAWGMQTIDKDKELRVIDASEVANDSRLDNGTYVVVNAQWTNPSSTSRSRPKH